jgi:hypothetical protein
MRKRMPADPDDLQRAQDALAIARPKGRRRRRIEGGQLRMHAFRADRLAFGHECRAHGLILRRLGMQSLLQRLEVETGAADEHRRHAAREGVLAHACRRAGPGPCGGALAQPPEVEQMMRL